MYLQSTFFGLFSWLVTGQGQAVLFATVLYQTLLFTHGGVLPGLAMPR